MKLFDTDVPTRVLFGDGVINTLGKQIQGSFSKILVVADPVAFDVSGARTALEKQLAGLTKNVFDGVKENPPLSTLETGSQIAKDLGAELIIGVGGGSAMDTAKGIAVLCTNPGPMQRYLEGEPLEKDPLPTVCIPTTSGTGSEATPFAVFTGETNKQGLSHPKLYPILSIIDPELTYSMPKSLTLSTGLDALTHAVEAYLSLDASPRSDTLALEAATGAISNLEAASTGDRGAMNKMALASLTAGIAIGHASTILPHIMGYPLTFFHDVPHGLASALLMPAFLKFLGESSSDKSKVKTIDSLFADRGGVKPYLNSLGIETGLCEYGVKESEFSTYADMTIIKGDIKITPATVSRETIIDLYRQSQTQ